MTGEDECARQLKGILYLHHGSLEDTCFFYLLDRTVLRRIHSPRHGNMDHGHGHDVSVRIIGELPCGSEISSDPFLI